MKSFSVPLHYRSPLISAVKAARKAADKMKKDFSPTRLQIGNLTVFLARHFGFCYGVENAIEIAFRAVAENPDKRIFLLSEMIHNPGVNADLLSAGVSFLMDTKGQPLVDWESLQADDIVIIPAFGTTVELEQKLRDRGIEPTRYETTCPFVEKVWNRAEKIGMDGFSVVVHGKPGHEETRATFSHSRVHTPTVVVRDMAEAELLCRHIAGELSDADFYARFAGQYSEGFVPSRDLKRIGVVNQTTMLASETAAIAERLREAVLQSAGAEGLAGEVAFADTRDTLCYATSDNQGAVLGMLSQPADLALVIGGYNSSNTSHLLELCEQYLPSFYIDNASCLESRELVRHYDMHRHAEVETQNWLPDVPQLRVLITAGASSPDALVERVIHRLALLTGNDQALEGLAERTAASGVA